MASRASTAKTKGKTATPSQQAGLAKARAAAHAAHPSGALTPAQLSADRANLVLARAAAASHKGSQSPAQLAAERANMAKARAVEHAVHGSGHQTPKQLAAERANLSKARAAYVSKYGHAYGSHRGHHAKFGNSRGNRRFGPAHKPLRPIGLTQITFNMQTQVKQPRLTGRHHRFQSRISPSSSNQQTGWRMGRVHRFQKHPHMRRKALIKNGKWLHTRNRLVGR